MHALETRPGFIPLIVVAALLALTGCAASHKALAPELAPMQLADSLAPAPTQPPILTENHFRGDRAAGITEEALRKVLEAPVFLEEKARIGVLPVASGYAPDEEVPLAGATAVLADALESSNEFELTSEVSTDFPAQSGVAGLRELAARYRADYLLLYRQRFVSRDYLNGVAWGYATGLGALFLPGNTLETAGVLEATLFDVKTGTILFTVQERTGGEERVNNWHVDLKRQWLQKRLLETATQKLAKQVVAKVHRLAVARVTYEEEGKQRVVTSPAPSLESPGGPAVPVDLAFDAAVR